MIYCRPVFCPHRDDDAEGRMKYARGTKYEQKEWFYGKITRQEAESWLSRLADHGDFLIRQSESNVSISKLHLLSPAITRIILRARVVM